MRRIIMTSLMAYLAVASSLPAAPPTPAETLQALKQEQQQASNKLNKAYGAAKTQADKNRLYEEYRKTNETLTRRAMDLARKHPKDPAAFDALEWIISGGLGWSPATAEALDLVHKDYVRDKRLGKIVSITFAYWNLYPSAEPFLREVKAKNPDRRVQGLAASSLASILSSYTGTAAYLKEHPEQKDRGLAKPIAERLRQSTPEQLKKETEAAYQLLIDKYADVKPLYGKRTLGQRAEAKLFEMRHLQVGQVAPEIQGDDIDGHHFKLSDYRGKVVLLDFWGNW